MPEMMDNTPVRAAVLRSGIALSAIDAALGVSQHRTARALGIAKCYRYANGQRVAFRQQRVTYDFAERVVRVIGIDPMEAGV